MKLLSVIIPTYNRAGSITKALDSIPERDDIEIIVVDDCSTDNTLELLKNYTRELIILKTACNSGPGIARNLGLDVAKGKYITFLDSDDGLVTDNLSKVLDNINNTFDIIGFNNKLLNGSSGGANDNKIVFQGQFVKKSIIGNTRFSNSRGCEDREFVREIKNKQHSETYNDTCIYIYNLREGGPNKEEDTLTYKYLSTHGFHY